MPSHDVLVVLFEGVQSLDVTGPLDVFAGAGNAVAHLAARAATDAPPDPAADAPDAPDASDTSAAASDAPSRAPTRPAPPRAYRVRTASLGGAPVRTSAGLRLLPDADLAEVTTTGTLVVPGGPGTRPPDPDVVARIAALAPAAERVVSICTGAFLLAEAGLLAGRRATTHWAYCDTLARRFPDTEVDAEPIFVRDGRYATSAGVTSGIDLALALVEDDHGRDVALAVARGMVVFLRRPGGQAQFSAQLAAQLAERHPLREVQRWITEHPEADLGVEALADRAALSPRQFARAFRAEVGVTPGQYVDRARLEAARRLLEDTGAGVAEVARSAGYGTPEAMRRAFVRTLAVPPAEYRRRFHSARS